MVVAALDDTCIEMYKVFGGERYKILPKTSVSLSKYQVFRYFAVNGLDESGNVIQLGSEDVTGTIEIHKCVQII